MNTSPYPIILCGDFNDTPTSFTYKQLSEGLMIALLMLNGIRTDLYEKFPTLRIDYILHSPELS